MLRLITTTLLFLLFLPASNGYGQGADSFKWDQTVTITTAVTDNSILEVLRDSLAANAHRRDLKLQSDSSGLPVPAAVLDRELRDSSDVSLNDASHATIAYQFRNAEEGFQQRIQWVQLYTRKSKSASTEEYFTKVPIVYIDPSTDWLNRFMSSGPSLSKTMTQNYECVLMNSFGEQMAFPKLIRSPDARIISLDGNDVTDGHMTAKRAFVEKITRLYYSSQ